MFGVSGLYISIFWGIPALVAFVIMILMGMSNIILGFFTALVFSSLAMPVIYLWFFVHYAITDQRVMTREGIIKKQFITADLPSVTDITVNETFFERILTRTGEIGVNTAGSDFIELHFKHIRKPFVIRHDIYKHQNNWRDENGVTKPNGHLHRKLDK